MLVVDPKDTNTPVAAIIGNYRPALGVAKQLKAAGYRVVLCDQPGTRGAERSRYVDAFWDLQSPQLGAKAFQKSIQKLLHSETNTQVILPIDETYLNLCDAIRGNIPNHVTLAMVEHRVIETCHDKLKWLEFCQKSGINCPSFGSARTKSQLRELLNTIGLPVVIRPVTAGERIGSRKAVTVDTMEAFENTFKSWPKEAGDLLAQRYFDGDRYNLYFGAIKGEVVRQLHSRSLRTDRIDGSGQSIEGTIVDPVKNHSDMLALAVAGMNYTGVGCAQFLYDPKTQESCFLEINPRFGASHVFVEATGFAMTQMAIDIAQGKQLAEQNQQYSRIRFIWSYGDLAGLLYSLKNGEVNTVQALQWMARIPYSALTADIHTTWSIRDPMPAIGFYLDKIRDFVGFTSKAPPLHLEKLK